MEDDNEISPMAEWWSASISNPTIYYTAPTPTMRGKNLIDVDVIQPLELKEMNDPVATFHKINEIVYSINQIWREIK